MPRQANSRRCPQKLRQRSAEVAQRRTRRWMGREVRGAKGMKRLRSEHGSEAREVGCERVEQTVQIHVPIQREPLLRGCARVAMDAVLQFRLRVLGSQR